MEALDEEIQRRIAAAVDQVAIDVMSGASLPKAAPAFTPICGLRGFGGCTMCDTIIHRSTPCDRAGCPKNPTPHPGLIRINGVT